jgi:hypothetical protein
LREYRIPRQRNRSLDMARKETKGTGQNRSRNYRNLRCSYPSPRLSDS